MSNYRGPGIYKHYKGGTYLVHGLVRREYDETEHVQYESLSPEYRSDQFHLGYIGTVRPLNESDGPDCFNSVVETGVTTGTEHVQHPIMVPRFTKVSE